MASLPDAPSAVAGALARSPVIGVVRTGSAAEAGAWARTLIAGGVELIEVTWTVPDGPDLVRALIAERAGDGPPFIGMGTITTGERAGRALAAGSEFVVSPNVSREVAAATRDAGRFLVLGALTCSEIVAAVEAGADIVKVYPLPSVGGPSYLETVRQPLGDLPMLAAGGFGVEEIPRYRRAGASAFGIGAPLLGVGAPDPGASIGRALELARGGG